MSNLKLKKFPMKLIKDNSSIAIICKRGGGKSFLTRNILWHKRDIPVGCVISPTEGSNRFYSNFVPKLFIHTEYSSALVENFMKRQKKVTRMKKNNPEIDNRAFIAMDDCMYNANEWSHDKAIKYLMFNGRHEGVLSIIILQYVMGLPPNFRGNFDYVFILREPYLNIRNKLYENFAGMFPSKEIFYKVMDICTENYGCIVIDCVTKSNKLEDQVYWYKAEEVGDFKMGADAFWSHHYNNGGDEDEDKEDEEEFDPSQFRRKQIKVDVKRVDYSNNEYQE